MSADNALSQIQIASLRVLVDGAIRGSDTAQQSAFKFDSLGAPFSTIIEDGLEFYGIGTYGGARKFASNLSSVYVPPQLTAAMVSALTAQVGNGLAGFQTATKAQTGLFAALMLAILSQTGLTPGTALTNWVTDMQTKFNALTGLT